MITGYYIHGFASSPRSTKAGLLRQALADVCPEFHIPDLNLPDFEHLDIDAGIAHTVEVIQARRSERALVIASSLGAFIALHAMPLIKDTRGISLLLLAPGLRVERINIPFFAPEVLAHWQKFGFVNVYHFGYRDQRRLCYGFYESMCRYAGGYPPVPKCDARLIHGSRDEVVPLEDTRDYARGCGVPLTEVDDTHELMNSLDIIEAEARALITKLRESVSGRDR